MLQHLIISRHSLLYVSKVKDAICSFVTKVRTTKTITIEEVLLPESWLSSWN